MKGVARTEQTGWHRNRWGEKESMKGVTRDEKMGWHRIRGEGSRWGSAEHGVASGRISPARNPNRRGFSPGLPEPQQPPRKADILMEAGRLAAEYLVSKGLLPPDSLPGKWHTGPPQPPPIADGRTPALARLGNAPDVGRGRRRFDDEHDRQWPRKHSGGKRKMGHYDRRHDSDWGDWGRWKGTHGPQKDRARGYSDSGGEEDFAPRFHRDWRGGFRDAGIKGSRVSLDEPQSRSEASGESGLEHNSSSSRKDHLPMANVDLDRQVDDSRILNSEAGDEAKSHASSDFAKRTLPKEIPVEDGHASEHNKDLLKLCMFAKVPTRPRSSLAHTIPKVDGGEASSTFEIAPAGASRIAVISSSDPHANQTNNLKYQALDNSSALSVQSMEIPDNPRLEYRIMVDVGEDSFTHGDKMEEIKRESKSSPSKVSQENGHFLLNFKARQSSPSVGRVPEDEEMIEAVDRGKPVVDVILQSCESEFIVNMEKEQQLEPPSFKIFDLNLMGTPEITEVPDDPPLDQQPTILILETKKKLSVYFDLSTRSNTNGGDDYNQISGDDKVAPVINLEDDSPIEDNINGSSKPKSGVICSSLEDVVNHTPPTADIRGTQDGYSLEISELLGSEISRCPSVQADLNNLPTETSLQSTEGFPGDDDPIYLSLGELPISFMEVWDQPPQDFAKFF